MRGDSFPNHWLRDCIIAGVVIGILVGIVFGFAWVLAHLLVVISAHLRPV